LNRAAEMMGKKGWVNRVLVVGVGESLGGVEEKVLDPLSTSDVLQMKGARSRQASK